MATVQEALATALTHHRAGRTAQAEALYRAVLDAVPGHADARHLLGVARLQSGHPGEAAEHIAAAIALDGGVADYHDNLGSALRALGRAEEAVAAHRRALALRRDFPQALFNLGNALDTLGRTSEAAESYRRAVRLNPGYAKAHFNLGNALAALDRVTEAEAAYRAALAADPGFVEARVNLAARRLARGAAADADRLLRPALALRPDHATALANRAAVLIETGTAAPAATLARRAVAAAPDLAEARVRLGDALVRLNRPAEAAGAYAAAAALRPDLPEAWSNLAFVRQTQGDLDAAEAGYRRALAVRPDLAEVRSNLAYLDLFRPGVTLAGVLAAHRAWDAVHGAPLRQPRRGRAAAADARRPLRVGIVSGDFRRHPAGSFTVRVAEALPAEGVRLLLYANQREADDLTARFRAAAERWVEVAGLSDAELAARIRADGVDVLIDLAGHNARGRLGVFARRAAPVQVAWAGYMATTGLATMDALVADRFHVPEGAEAFYTERILRMPDAFIAYDPPADAPEPGPPPCLGGAPITFGAFNILTKMGPPVVACWAALLNRVPGSRLLMKTKALSCPVTAAAVRARFAAAGVDPARLELAGATSAAEHMAWCRRVDVALDPFPFAGSTTTLETLWMGVPVVTLPGETFSSRHSLAFLSVLGLDECVAADADDYVARAAALAGDPGRLAEWRTTLRARMAAGPLCDGPRLARALGAALRAEVARGG
ncbi:tetratricopeptide repeat protein [Azospirillum halopraeferens]|uniref:O-linked N-acetylglucosamine transferase, SPINDLY family protein n=1 Tax=Azospirillum halopraeferens TaxID=34010 RepID=UPI0004248CBF|nr:tetratricopeptide repeat protein [Azospirillum halopraeferens]